MIEFDNLYLADIRDDFEEAGRGERNFDLWDFINDDKSRAFAIGFLYQSLVKDKMWIPVSIRKQMRRLNEGMEIYKSQLDWVNSKYTNQHNEINIKDYVSFVLSNVFIDNDRDLLKLAILLGINISNNNA